MTTTISTRPVAIGSDSLLRFAIRADATGCAGLGLLVALAAELLPLTGVGVGLLLATVAATLGLAYVQYLGVRRSA